MAGPAEFQADGARVGAGLEYEVIFQPAGVPVVNHVDAWIHGAIAHARVVGDVGVPVLAAAQEIVGVGRKLVERFDPGRPIGIQQPDVHTLGIRKGNDGAAGGEQQGITVGARGVAHGGVPLAPVGFEAQRQSPQRRLGLRERGVGAGWPTRCGQRGSGAHQ